MHEDQFRPDPREIGASRERPGEGGIFVGRRCAFRNDEHEIRLPERAQRPRRLRAVAAVNHRAASRLLRIEPIAQAPARIFAEGHARDASAERRVHLAAADVCHPAFPRRERGGEILDKSLRDRRAAPGDHRNPAHPADAPRRARGLPQPHREESREIHRDWRVLGEETEKILPRNPNEIAVANRAHRGGARFASEHGHLADRGAAFQHIDESLGIAEPDEHFHAAVDEDEDRVRLVFLAAKNFATRQADPLQVLIEGAQVRGFQAGEDRREVQLAARQTAAGGFEQALFRCGIGGDEFAAHVRRNAEHDGGFEREHRGGARPIVHQAQLADPLSARHQFEATAFPGGCLHRRFEYA